MNEGAGVSIVVPVHNGAATLEGSLGSLFKQSLQEIEVIAVDDASTDGSREILERLRAEDSRLNLVLLDKNAGVHEARIAGLRVATAPWVGFLDADDYAKPTMFRTLFDAGQGSHADIAICGSERRSLTGKFLGDKVCFRADELVEESIFERFCRMEFGMGSLCNKLYRRDLILTHGTYSFRWRQDASEDTIVNIGCFWEARRVRILSACLHEYALNPESATQSVGNAESYARFLRAYAVAVDTYHSRGRAMLDGIATLYRHQLSYDCYRMERMTDLERHQGELTEAIRLLAEKDPLGLASMVPGEFKDENREIYFVRSLNEWLKLTSDLPGLFVRGVKRRFGGFFRR